MYVDTPLSYLGSDSLCCKIHSCAVCFICRRQRDGKRIVYTVTEYDPLLDSSNMTYEDYARLASDIEVRHHLGPS